MAMAGLAILALASAPMAFAHGGGPRLLLEPDRSNPGGVVTVRGEDLGSDELITFSVVGIKGAIPIGDMIADGEGHLTVALQVPVDMAVGVYALEATQASGARVANAPLFVEGAPILPGEGGPGGKDEDDTLLIVLPAGWQQSLSGPIVTAIPVTSAGPGKDLAAGAPEMGLLVGLIVLVVGAAAMGLVLAGRWRGRRAAGTGPPAV